jgi:transposase InsO family protein
MAAPLALKSQSSTYGPLSTSQTSYGWHTGANRVMLLSDDRSSKSAVGRAYRAVSVQSQPRSAVGRLFAFLVVGHARRQLLWFAVTRNPSAERLAQQMAEAFPWNTAPTYLVRDNDRAYGQVFQRRIRAMGIRDRPISPRSPWQNPYAERLIGTLRRECLDHVLIVGERHLRRMLASYSSYYNESRTERSSPRQFFPDCTIAMCGYDFREGQGGS